MDRFEIVRITEYDEILSIIQRFDNKFSPSIMSRVQDLQAYASKLKEFAEVFITRDEITTGFIAFYSNDVECAFISLIAVLENYRKSGMGQALIRKCFEISKSKGIKKVQLEVYKNNVTAIKFYEKLGFTIINDKESMSYLMERKVIYDT